MPTSSRKNFFLYISRYYANFTRNANPAGRKNLQGPASLSCHPRQRSDAGSGFDPGRRDFLIVTDLGDWVGER